MSREALLMLAEAYGAHLRDGTAPNALQLRQTAELLTLICRQAEPKPAGDPAAEQRLRDLAALLPGPDAPASQQAEWLVSVFAAGWANDGDLYVGPDELPTLVLALRAITHRIRELERQLGIQAPPVRSLAQAFGHLAGLAPAEPPPPGRPNGGGLVA